MVTMSPVRNQPSYCRAGFVALVYPGKRPLADQRIDGVTAYRPPQECFWI